MRKFIAHFITAFVPSRKLRHKIRNHFSRKAKMDPMEKNVKIIINNLSRKMQLLRDMDIWTLPSGIKFYLPLYPYDIIQECIVDHHEFFEQRILDDLREYIPEHAVILDIGANIGNHSLFWACNMGAEKIHSFEPVHSTYNMLIKNIEINNLQSIIIPHNVGLGDKKSSGDISVQSSENIGGTVIKETKTNPTKYYMQIERLDDIDLGIDHIDFIKIDVEGFEIKTLDGAKKTISKYKPIVFIESFPKHYSFVEKFFTDMGYTIEKSYKESDNYLFVPPKKSK